MPAIRRTVRAILLNFSSGCNTKNKIANASTAYTTKRKQFEHGTPVVKAQSQKPSAVKFHLGQTCVPERRVEL